MKDISKTLDATQDALLNTLIYLTERISVERLSDVGGKPSRPVHLVERIDSIFLALTHLQRLRNITRDKGNESE